MSSKVIWSDHQRVGEWVAASIGAKWRDGDCAIGFERDGALVAGVYYTAYTGASILMNGRVDGMAGRSWWWAIFDYPFDQLKVKRLSALVSSANHKSKRLVEHLGFFQEATLKDYCVDGDGLVYRMGRDECKFIGDTHGQRWIGSGHS